MSLESDLISEDLQLSPATISEKYSDEAHSTKMPFPDGTCCHFHGENGQEYIRLSETDSANVHSIGSIDHQHFDCCEHHGHEFIYPQSQHHDCDCPEHHHYECVCPEPNQHRYHRIPHWSTITMSDDDIEIISDSEYYRQCDDVFYIEPSVARSLFSGFFVKETPSNVHIHVDTRTQRQRFIARTVMIISMVMFTVSVLLVIVSLIMSDHIDSLVRNANILLTKTSVPTTSVTSTAVTLILINGTISNSTDFG